VNYETYCMKPGERIRYGLEAAILTGVTAYCFYDSFWVCLLYPLILLRVFKKKKKELQKQRQESLLLQFRDAVQAIAAALAAGYSAEHALAEARKDLQLVGSKNQEMVQELWAMQRKLDANQTVEEAIRHFAERSGLEEAEVFAEVFTVGKRSGGNLIEIMKDTARTISDTTETKRQIAAILASRRYEQKIMSVMPFAILVYLRIGCPGFLDPLYHNLTGILAATACLGIYLFAGYLGERLLKIEV